LLERKDLQIEWELLLQDRSRMPTSNGRPFAIWVIVAGLVFSGSDLLYGIIPDLKNFSKFDPFIGLVGGFVVLCFFSGLGVVFTQRRWSFILSTVVSLGFALPSLFVYPQPMQFTTFVIATSSIPVLILVSIFSILSLLNLKKGLRQKKYLSSPRSVGGVLTVAALLFVCGAVSFGALQPHGIYTDAVQVIIVPGASSASNPTGHFSPQTITVVIGANNTVTWVNEDYSIHTVTSNTGIFDSGLLNSGDKWSYTFSTPGTYAYHCAIHPFMLGTIIVESAS
jgi:plastocyanin